MMKALPIIALIVIVAAIGMLCATVMAFLDHFDNN